MKCRFFFFSPPREELGLSIPGIAAGFRTIRTVCAGSEWPQCATLTGPVCPAEGDQPKLPAYSETRARANLRPRPLS